MVKSSTVDLEADKEEEETRKVKRWTQDEEVLLCKCWVEVSRNNQIEADRNDESFWRQITDDFNQGSYQGTRPAGKPQTQKRPKIRKRLGSRRGKSIGISKSGSISESLFKDLRRKMQAAESAYEAKKAKELAYIECKELEFLMIDLDTLAEPKATIIRKKQENIRVKAIKFPLTFKFVPT
ncbi:hypothetical protein Tco_1218039 [Tanacetum coccineum]